MQIAAVALILTQFITYSLSENPGIWQMFEPLIITADKKQNFPVRIGNFNAVYLGNYTRHLFIPLLVITQKTFFSGLQLNASDHRHHVLMTLFLTVNSTSPE